MSTAVENPFMQLSWKELRKEAKANDIKSHGVKRPQLAQILYERLPDYVVPEKELPKSRYVKLEQHTRDAMKILDKDGNMLCMIYRQGREIDGEKAELPMYENAKKCENALRRLT